MTALGAEVVWTRLLSLMLGGTVYTFSIILAVFLFGLGIGSAVGSALARRSRRPRTLLGWCQLLLTGAIAWTAYMLARIPAVLADRPVAVGKSVDQFSTGPGALPVGAAAGDASVGREFSAGAGGGRGARAGPRAARRRTFTPRTPSAGSSAASASASVFIPLHGHATEPAAADRRCRRWRRC